MTNKQAIGALNRIRCIIREDSLEEQALVYAIEAIKAQGTNVEDIIYRKAEIEPEAISKWEKEFREYVDSLDITMKGIGIIEYIDELPPIQPKIIRCKDCAYCDSDVVNAPYGLTKKIWWCDRLYEEANENLMVEPDDFCSFAKRRDE